MILTNEQICSVALGAAEITCSPLGVDFYRMRKAQAEAIRAFSADFGNKAYATAGIRLDFYTDSEFFAFAYDDAKAASSRKQYYFTLLVNGKEVALVGEENAAALAGEARVALPQGNNRVTLFFPNVFRARIKRVELSDASFEPFRPERRFVFHGDSITHGYDARSAANSYANRIATACNAEAFNFAIAAACFDPRMIDETNDHNADAVFVAYGTNDWAKKSNFAEFSSDCEAFFRKLTSLHKSRRSSSFCRSGGTIIKKKSPWASSTPPVGRSSVLRKAMRIRILSIFGRISPKTLPFSATDCTPTTTASPTMPTAYLRI